MGCTKIAHRASPSSETLRGEGVHVRRYSVHPGWSSRCRQIETLVRPLQCAKGHGISGSVDNVVLPGKTGSDMMVCGRANTPGGLPHEPVLA